MLKIQITNINSPFYKVDKVNFINEGDFLSYFELGSSEFPELSVRIKYPFKAYADYKYSDIVVHPFFTPVFYKESHIFQVNEPSLAEPRIGWIFPIQSLVSNEHHLSENEHFLKYVYIVYQRILKGDFFSTDLSFSIPANEIDISLSDIYPGELIVLAFSVSKTKLIANFSVDNYFHSLFVRSYFFCSDRSQVNTINRVNAGVPAFTKISIHSISSDLRSEIFIKALFKVHLVAATHPLVKFHFLYQIVELLIEKILDQEVTRILAIAAAKTKTPHEIKQDFNDVASEEYRIRKLFDRFLTKQPVSSQDLVRTCNLLLVLFGNEKLDVVSAFYQTRNTLFHSFRKVTDFDPDLVLVSEINLEFEKVLVDVLSFFTEVEIPPKPVTKKVKAEQASVDTLSIEESLAQSNSQKLASVSSKVKWLLIVLIIWAVISLLLLFKK